MAPTMPTVHRMLDRPMILPRLESVEVSAIFASETGRSAPVPRPTRIVPVRSMPKLAAKTWHSAPTAMMSMVAEKTGLRPKRSPRRPPNRAPQAMARVIAMEAMPYWPSPNPMAIW